MSSTPQSTQEANKVSENEITKKVWFWFSLVMLLILAFSPSLVYMTKFKSGSLSANNIDWSQFGTYLSGTLSPVIALTGAILTFTLGYVSYRHNQTLLKKQEREKRPLVNVSFMDKDLRIKIAYNDIYDTAMPVYTKSFSWFKRHINNPQAPKKN